MVLRWNPACLTGQQLDSVQNFACSLQNSKDEVTKIKTDQLGEDVEEVLEQIRVFVKDPVKKLQMTNDGLHAKRQDDTAEHLEDTTAEMACDVMSKFEYPTSLHAVCVTGIIICF